MTPNEAFRQARDQLMSANGDPERASASFRWPQLEAFNWTTHWFDELATGNQRPALRVITDSGQEAVSFDDLLDRSRRVARYLRDAGVERGDRMLLMLTNVVPLWETMLAAIRLGAVVIPATPQLTSADIDDRIERGGVRHMITDPQGAAKLTRPERLKVKLVVGEASGFTPFDDARAAAGSIENAETRADEPLLLHFSSGTTAKPELVLHTHASYPVGHLSTMYWLGLREGDIHQNISSPGWAKHAWSCFFAPWNAGATVLVHEARFSARRTIEVLRREHVNTLCAPPTVWRMVALETLGERPSQLRELASAGEPLNPEGIDSIQQAWGITIRDGYGQTETTALVGNAPGLTVKPGSMGKPLPGYDVVLLDGEDGECDEGEVALRLTPRPLGLMQGYADDASRTDRAMASGFYRTGDEARRDTDGYVHFIGRGDDVFKSSDYRISPFEIESALLEHEAVAEAAVVPSPDPLRLSVPKAFVVLKPGVEENAVTTRSILEFCRTTLAPYKRVRRLEFAVLPKTISGKIRRIELRKREAEQRSRGERGPSEFWLDDN